MKNSWGTSWSVSGLPLYLWTCRASFHSSKLCTVRVLTTQRWWSQTIDLPQVPGSVAQDAVHTGANAGIGSTAVPDIPAKPIIDLLVGTDDVAETVRTIALGLSVDVWRGVFSSCLHSSLSCWVFWVATCTSCSWTGRPQILKCGINRQPSTVVPGDMAKVTLAMEMLQWRPGFRRGRRGRGGVSAHSGNVSIL